MDNQAAGTAHRRGTAQPQGTAPGIDLTARTTLFNMLA